MTNKITDINSKRVTTKSDKIAVGIVSDIHSDSPRNPVADALIDIPSTTREKPLRVEALKDFAIALEASLWTAKAVIKTYERG